MTEHPEAVQVEEDQQGGDFMIFVFFLGVIVGVLGITAWAFLTSDDKSSR